ncbi:MAG: hypothetical protein NC127_03720 [Muribaculum sp.]|nr:hypothetical protein [Muribaculum sp.]
MKKRSGIVTIILAIALLGAIAVYHIYTRTAYSPIELSKARYPITGFDFSAHNGFIDFDRLVQDSVDFVILKATEGTTFKDSRFNANYRNARRAGIPVIGAYHFFRFDTDGEMQAINFINSLQGKTIDMPLVIDLEEWTNPRDIYTHEVLARLKAMIGYIEANGYTVMFYTNKDGYMRFIREHFKDYPLWICSFTDPPLGTAENNEWQLWQYSHRGWINSCNTSVDLNTFNGSEQEWEQWLRSSTF